MSGHYYTEMADRLRAAGLNVIEQSGWQSRARSSGGFSDGRPWCVMWHHTASGPEASAKSDTDYMSYNSDSKPIANIMIARNGDVWLLAAGATNTNGKGTGDIHTSRGRVPNDNMNTYAFGMEIQNTGTGQAYSPECMDACFRTSLALTAMAGLLPSDVGTHQAYAWDRKIDPAQAWSVGGGWQPRSINSSGSWSLADLRDELNRRAVGPAPTPPQEEDEMATSILHVPGRNAQFIGQGTKLADGSVHCLLVTWFGPGPEGNPFLSDHAAAPDIVHQDTLLSTLQRDIVFLGNPEEINDSTGPWRAEDFYRVIRS